MSQELKLRIISGVILAIVILGATWLGGLWFFAVAHIIGLLVYYEWCTITGSAKVIRAYALGWALLVATILAMLQFGFPIALVVVLVGILVLAILSPVLNGGRWLPVGFAYAGFSGISLAALRGDDFAGLVAMIFLFAVVWGTDIAAYFVGRAIGGPKLAPRISPGKTWSGAIGGAVVAVIASTLVVAVFLRDVGIGLIAIAFVLSVLSQLGDLFESHIKRRFGVKDSSQLIPGHGGVMDRVDGLVFAGFAAFLIAVAALQISGTGDSSLGTLLLGIR